MRPGSSTAEKGDSCWEALERRILEDLRRGERRNLGALVDRYGENLMGYLTTVLGRRDAAEDVFQETWVKVMERIHRFRVGSAFAPWLFRVARNGAYDRLRRKRRWRWSSLETARDDGPTHETAATDDLERRVHAGLTAERLVSVLEPDQREVLWLRFREGLSYEEIAARCSMPIGTVKSRVSRALDRLADAHARMEERDHDR